jgi:anthrone oxygenase-like protein
VLSTVLTGTSLVGSGVQAGALLMFYYGVCPTFRAVDVPDWLRMHVSMDHNIERYMPALNLATGGTSLALLFTAQDGSVRAIRIVALLCNIALALMSELVNVPINRYLKRGLPVLANQAPAEEQRELAHLGVLRERWIVWTQWRAAVIALGFVLYAIATLRAR